MKSKIFSIHLIIAMIFIGTTLHSQQIFRKMDFVSNNDSLPYRVLFPKKMEVDKKYPVIFFLHGSGERGADNELQLTHGADLFASEKATEKYPAIVIFPQCPKDDYWARVDRDESENGKSEFTFRPDLEATTTMQLLMKLIDSIAKEPWADQSRFYVGGLSMGGMGVFELLYRKPDVFVAAFPICGGGVPETTAAYATKVSLWVFHGMDDDIVSVSLSENMVKALIENGGNPRTSFYPGVNHNSWDAAFAEPGLLPWLFSNKK